MLDSNSLEWFSAWISEYGLLALWVTSFLGPLGVPIPSPLIFAAVGAFARQGLLSWPLAIAVALSANLVADSIVFGFGYFAKEWVVRRFGQSTSWKNAACRFRRQGGWAIFLTRFPFTPLAFPTTLVAGGSDFKFGKYLVFDIAGTLTFFMVYSGLGYLFGQHWQIIVLTLSKYTSWLLGLLILAIASYIGVRHLRANRRESACQSVD